jgi:DNA-binding beta-propeller fold protein YncE
MASVFVRANAAALNDSQTAFAGSVAIDRGPIADLTANADTIVVANYGDNSVTVVRPDSAGAPAVVPVEGEPFAVALTDDRAFVVTSDLDADAVQVIDTRTNSVVGCYPLAFSVTAVAASPDGKRAYAARAGHDHVDVAVIDITADRVGTVDIGAGAGTTIDALAADPSGRRLYVAVTTSRGSRVVVVDTETAKARKSIAFGAPIRDLAVAADGTVYALTSDLQARGVIEVVDPKTFAITASIGAGTLPIQMALSADGARAYVVDYDQVAVLCTLTHEVVETITVGTRPAAAALNAEGDRLYVADVEGNVTAFRVAAPAPMYSPFDAVAFDAVRELAPVGV